MKSQFVDETLHISQISILQNVNNLYLFIFSFLYLIRSKTTKLFPKSRPLFSWLEKLTKCKKKKNVRTILFYFFYSRWIIHRDRADTLTTNRVLIILKKITFDKRFEYRSCSPNFVLFNLIFFRNRIHTRFMV